MRCSLAPRLPSSPSPLRALPPRPVASCRTTFSTSTSTSTSAATPAIEVVIFGWLGGREKYLQKYASLYASVSTLPIATRVHPTPIWDLIRPQAARQLAQRHAAGMIASAPTLRVWHCMSMGGVLMAGLTMHLLGRTAAGKAVLAQTAGVAFDSAPVPLTPTVMARGLWSGITNSKSILMLTSTTTASGIINPPPGLERVCAWYLQRSHVNRILREAVAGWTSCSPRLPRLFIYSVNDDVCTAAEVERTILATTAKTSSSSSSLYAIPDQSMGGNSERFVLRLEDSPHCQHLRTHPEPYRKEVERFLAIVMKSGGTDTQRQGGDNEDLAS